LAGQEFQAHYAPTQFSPVVNAGIVSSGNSLGGPNVTHWRFPAPEVRAGTYRQLKKNLAQHKRRVFHSFDALTA